MCLIKRLFDPSNIWMGLEQEAQRIVRLTLFHMSLYE
jgi:hypothetical protein